METHCITFLFPSREAKEAFYNWFEENGGEDDADMGMKEEGCFCKLPKYKDNDIIYYEEKETE